MPSYKLTYFNGRGRAEGARLLFAMAGVDFQDNRITGEEFGKIKASTPFGQLPTLEVDGQVFAQSRAIWQFLAREFGLYGKNNLEAFKIDEAVSIVDDFFQAAIKTFFAKPEEKDEKMKNFTENDLPKYFGMLEKALSKNSSGFFVGASATLADIVCFDFISGLELKHPGLVDKAPKVKAHLQKVGAIENIKKWVEKRPKTEF